MAAPLFEAVLEPNPPLCARTIALIGCALGALSFIAGMIFVANGAWPVTPFLGADIALLVWALLANARAARRRERIVITPELLSIERFAANGKQERQDIPSYWLHVEHEDPERIGAELALVGRRGAVAERTVVGSFLSPDDKASLAGALREALHRLRNPTFSP